MITLTTDFGLTGYHPGVMKGVLLSHDPGAVIVDLCHGIAPGAVDEGAWTLLWSWRYFPPGTVHLAVVDPGVGGARRALAAGAAGHYFVGPDNGLLSPVLRQAGHAEIVELALPRESDEGISSTFHGRDVFAPAAGRLSRGASLTEIGRPMEEIITLELPRPCAAGEGRVEGQVVSVDPFGNLITNITSGDLRQAGIGRRARVELGGETLHGLHSHYAEAGEQALLALINSSGHLEIALNRGSAAAGLSLGKGNPVLVRKRQGG